MPKLVAKFDIEIPGQCLIAWPSDEPIIYNISIDSFDVAIRLVIDRSWGIQGKDESHFLRSIERAEVSVSRLEEEFPPVVTRNERGTMDYTIQSDYFAARSPAFEYVAREAINRLIAFFRFVLNTPLLQAIPVWHHSLRNPTWTDESGKLAGKASGIMTVRAVKGAHGELGVRRFTPELSDMLLQFLGNPFSPSLVAEILSDAQSAWFEGNLRRCVLELAIACEVTVKRFFFAADSPAGAAFDYLEDKSKVSVRILELIDQVSLDAFARSFRVDQPGNFKQIDYLFRCRNKVAHRGELSYRDETGNNVDVDARAVRAWWDSVTALRSWLTRSLSE